MKKVILLSALLASLDCQSSFAQEDKIYCPDTVICKGTPETCYVSTPKNNDGNFILDKNHYHSSKPNGVYKFVQALYDLNLAEGFCKFSYTGGSTDPHTDTVIYYENNIRMTYYDSGTGWPRVWQHDGIHSMRCPSNNQTTNSQECPFIPKA